MKYKQSGQILYQRIFQDLIL